MCKNKGEYLPEKVWVTQEHNDVYEGSCIDVRSETQTTYTGIWSFRGGSCEVTVEKKFCEERNEAQVLKGYLGF